MPSWLRPRAKDDEARKLERERCGGRGSFRLGCMKEEALRISLLAQAQAVSWKHGVGERDREGGVGNGTPLTNNALRTIRLIVPDGRRPPAQMRGERKSVKRADMKIISGGVDRQEQERHETDRSYFSRNTTEAAPPFHRSSNRCHSSSLVRHLVYLTKCGNPPLWLRRP